MNNNLCLATNYLTLSESARQMWTDLDRHLAECGSRLVLLNSVLADPPLPFPVIPISVLIRDYAQNYPGACAEAGFVSRQDFELLENDRSRAQGSYLAAEALPGLIACRNFAGTLLKTLRPGYVLAWDSTSPLAAILRTLSCENGLPFQTLERGLLPETMAVESRGIFGYSDLRTHWLAQDIPTVGEGAYERIRSYYLTKKPEKYDHPPFGGGGAELRARLGLGSKKVVVFFGHYDACGLEPQDSNQRRYHSPVFASTEDALMAVRAELEKSPEVALIFKPHPIDRGRYAGREIQGVEVVQDANPHALIDLADVVVAQFTTLQFEAGFYEKPVVLLGRSAWWGRNATYEVNNREDLRPALVAAFGRTDWKTRSANARAFLTWTMDQFHIGCTPTVPARRNLRDFARFIARTSLDCRGIPPWKDRWEQAQAALDQMRGVAAPQPAHRTAPRAAFGAFAHWGDQMKPVPAAKTTPPERAAVGSGSKLKELQSALKANPADAGSWVELGVSFRELNQVSECHEALQEALRLDPRNQAALLECGRTHLQQQQLWEARSCFERLEEINPRQVETILLMAQHEAAEGDCVAARLDYLRALKLDPENAVAKSRITALRSDTAQSSSSSPLHSQPRQVEPSNTAESLERSLVLSVRPHRRYWWYRMAHSDFVPPVYSFLKDDEWALIEAWFGDTEEQQFIGESPIPFMSMLQALIMGNRIGRLVQLGTYAGYSSLLMGFMLRHMGMECGLFSADVDQVTTEFARKYVGMAGLDRQVKLVLSDSKRPELAAEAIQYFRGQRPQVVIIDSSHQREQTVVELDLWYDTLSPGGFMVLHDSSAFAQQWDSTCKGGVKAAIEDWMVANPNIPCLNVDCAASVDPASPYFAYQDTCGIGIVYKRKDRKPLNLKAT